ncbi:hypothetical protein BC567DRAFT_267600 [Phyllosticta citribraziliensis]
MSSSPEHPAGRRDRACDTCHLMQKRCDKTPDGREAPCGRCHKHDIECTYNRVLASRGRPYNRNPSTPSRPTRRFRRSLRNSNASRTPSIAGQGHYEPTTPRLGLPYDDISPLPCRTSATRASARRAGIADRDESSSRTPYRMSKHLRDASPTTPSPIRIAAGTTTRALRPGAADQEAVPAAQTTLDGWLKTPPDTHEALNERKKTAADNASEKVANVGMMGSAAPSSSSRSNRSSDTVVDELPQASSFSSSHVTAVTSDAATASINAAAAAAAADPVEIHALETLTNLQAHGCINWDLFHFMNDFSSFIGLEEHGAAVQQQQQQQQQCNAYGGGEASAHVVGAASGARCPHCP